MPLILLGSSIHLLHRCSQVSRRRIVVVGGGTSGATVSMSLATRTDHEVIVVESGTYSGLDNESRFLNILADSSLHSLHEVQLVNDGPIVPYVQAHCLGGGSAINGLLLSSEIPDVAQGLTSYANDDQLGDVGRALLKAGGEKCQLWWNHGRWNPGRALMHLADGGRIRIVSDAVMEVLHNESVSTGVRTYSEVIEADAVVMCAGALATPRILLQSGLSSLNSEIGWGLQDHPAITFALELRHDSNAFFDTGVVSKGTTSAGEQYLIVAYERASWSESNLGLVSVILLTPYSRGSVRLVENDCQVQINMLDDARDVVSMREAVRVLMHTVSHTGFDTISHQIYADDEGRCLDDVRELSTVELDMWIRKNLRPVSHVASSCHQAVNSSGALKFVEGVFLADASVLPRVPPSTPAGPVTIESRRIAHLLEGLML